MGLPDLIEIVPLTGPVSAEITVPGSKSITNRALVLAALAEGVVTLKGALWSEDTQVMTDCLRALGFAVDVQPDPEEVCNRTITVQGLGGRIPRGGTGAAPLELFVGNAGTAARFLAAMVCLGDGVYRLHGVPRMHERPQAALFAALRELGYRVDSPNDKLPAVIFGSRRGNEAERVGNDPLRLLTSAATPKRCSVSVEESSQFASALLLCARISGWEVEVTGANEDEMPYVVMTREMVKIFPARGGEVQIEPDASSGSYFWAASEQFTNAQQRRQTKVDAGLEPRLSDSFTVTVAAWPRLGWQVDTRFVGSLLRFWSVDRLLAMSEKDCDEFKPWFSGATETEPSKFLTFSRSRDLGDSIMTMVVLAPLAQTATRFTELGRLRVQECERVVALRTELTKCGAKVVEEDDTLTVYPSKLHGAEIETYHDHRMAMCFAVLGLKVPGIKIKNPACVKKTFPNFFQKLATPPPRGLGAEIRDGHTGRRLAVEELFAD